eukprot:TRINITY_DN12197_c0_g1_i1.p1 TRINITY_DN12197_c0_g1~~TRINITY_DN12197_c0_g1_i1.p1  ORF type:complete len:150 (-),score=37.89 TRINITY_DN12197_c0_g1_i1:41-490(-)
MDQATPTKCSSLRKNDIVLLSDANRPCKIVSMSTSKTGKHGHAKVHLVAIDIFTGKKIEEISSSTHNLYVPEVQRYECQLVDIEEEEDERHFCTLLTTDALERDGLYLPQDETGEACLADFEAGKLINVLVTSCMGQEAIMGHKVVNEE